MNSFWLFLIMIVLWAPIAWTHFTRLRYLETRVRKLEHDLAMNSIDTKGNSVLIELQQSSLANLLAMIKNLKRN